MRRQEFEYAGMKLNADLKPGKHLTLRGHIGKKQVLFIIQPTSCVELTEENVWLGNLNIDCAELTAWLRENL